MKTGWVAKKSADRMDSISNRCTDLLYAFRYTTATSSHR